MRDKDVLNLALKYLEDQPEDWKLMDLTGRVLTKIQVIDMIRKDKKFRKYIVEQIMETAVNQWSRKHG